DVSSVLNNPFAIADMAATDVQLNEAAIGDIALRADFDRVTELVNVNIAAVHDGAKTIGAVGTYNAKAENDKLDIKAHFNHSELILFQPLLGKLVSDVSGTISADLRVSGSVAAPKISGRCRLDNAGFTVNYLKTPYRIDDEFMLTNSIIHL